MDYEAAYKMLFNAITGAIDEIERSRFVSREITEGVKLLKRAQQAAEEMYIEN